MHFTPRRHMQGEKRAQAVTVDPMPRMRAVANHFIKSQKGRLRMTQQRNRAEAAAETGRIDDPDFSRHVRQAIEWIGRALFSPATCAQKAQYGNRAAFLLHVVAA